LISVNRSASGSAILCPVKQRLAIAAFALLALPAAAEPPADARRAELLNLVRQDCGYTAWCTTAAASACAPRSSG